MRRGQTTLDGPRLKMKSFRRLRRRYTVSSKIAPSSLLARCMALKPTDLGRTASLPS
jgi:hypothetical protein